MKHPICLRLPALLALVACLAGCYTAPVAPQGAVPVPAARLLVQASEGDARIVVVRDAGMLGGGCYFGLQVNGRLIARMDTGESVQLRVPAGDLLLAGVSDPEGRALCSLARDFKIQREFSIKPGELKHFRIGVMAGGMDIMRSDF